MFSAAACCAGPCAAIAAFRALHHLFEGAALVGGISLDRLDQVRDQVVAQLELHVDVGEGLADPLPHGDELVVDHDDPQHEDDDHSENDPAGRGHEGLLGGWEEAWRRAEAQQARGAATSWLCRRHHDLGSEFQQKKTPGFWPGVTSPNGGSGGKGGCRPAITQSRTQRGRLPVGSWGSKKNPKIVIHSVHRLGASAFDPP